MKAAEAVRRLVKVGELTLTSSPSSLPAACLPSPSAVLPSRHNISSTCPRNYTTSSPPPSPAMDHHHSEVFRIAASIKSFHARGERFRIFHGSTNSTRKSALGRHPSKVVDTSRLSNVLSVNAETQMALVEPNVSMDRLVEATLEHNLIPPVVMEFPGITAGGGYSGTSGESSSFRHGFFDRTLRSVEMVLANGEHVVTCSDTQNPDLFRGAAGALGTLGVVTLLEIHLKPAKKYVEATYHPTSSTAEAVKRIRELADPANEDIDYVDGILFSPTHGALITARMVDGPTHPSTPIQRFSAPSDPWFYLHVQQKITTHTSPTTPYQELIPLPDYLFRYDRGGFWVGRAAFTYFHGLVPFNDWTRWFLDDFLHTRMLYKALHGSGHTERMFVQDLALPYRSAEEFIRYEDERLGIWPLWLCPLQPSAMPTMHPHDTSRLPDVLERNTGTPEQMLNIGLWGLGPPDREAFITANRDIEAKLKELNGMRWLYAQTYHSESEFWADFDRQWYDGLRRTSGAQGLPSVYEKVKVEAASASGTAAWSRWFKSVWPVPGLTGLRQAVRSGDYVQARASKWKDWVPRE